MDTKLLEDFICLTEHESFTAAARERNVTQSALSRRIKALEEWFGSRLVERDSHRFDLTPQGRIFKTEAQVILRRLHNAREAARVLDENKEVEITVASQNSIAQTLFPEWVRRIESRLDQVYLRLISEKLSECVDLLVQGQVNYMFCYAHEAQTLPIDESRFRYTTVGKEWLIPISAPDARGNPLFQFPGSPDRPVPFVAYVHDSVFGKAVDRLILDGANRCFLARRYENAYSHTLKSLVNEQLGLAWLPQSAIVTDLAKGMLCRAGDERWDIEFDIRLYYHHAPVSRVERTIFDTSLEMARAVDS